jgi:hypothetical protein
MLDKTVKGVYLVDVAIPNSHSLHSTMAKQLWKYTDLKEGPISIWQLTSGFEVPLVGLLSATAVIQDKLHEILKA